MRRPLFAALAAVTIAGLVACEDLIEPVQGNELTYRQCPGAPGQPTWFAVQDGDGAWQRVTATSGAFTFSLPSGRGGIAMRSGQNLLVVYATASEFLDNLPNCIDAARTVSGNVTGYTTADRVLLAMGESLDDFDGSSFPAPTTWQLTQVDGNVTDLAAVRYRVSTGTGIVQDVFPTSVLLRHNVTGTTTGTVNLGSATEAGAPLQRTLTATLASDEALTVLSYVSMPTTLANIAAYEATPTSGTVTAPFYGVSPDRLAAGESHHLYATAVRTIGNEQESRFATMTFREPEDQAVTFGPSLGPISVTVATRPSASYTVQGDYNGLFRAAFSQGTQSLDIVATRSYLGSLPGTTVTLSAPDLNGVSGFSSTWFFTPTLSFDWYFLATDAGLEYLNTAPTTYRGAERTGGYLP